MTGTPWTPTASVADLKPAHSNRAGLPDPWDQGKTGACQVHAIARQLIAFRLKAGLPPFMPSRAWMNWQGRAVAGQRQGESGGVNWDAILRALADGGVCSEELYPYTQGNMLDRRVLCATRHVSGPPPGAAEDAARHRVTAWATLGRLTPESGYLLYDLDQFRLCLHEGHCFVIDIPWYKGFQVLGGVLTVPSKAELDKPANLRGDDFDGAHALCITGYNEVGLEFDNSIGRDARGTIPWKGVGPQFVYGVNLITGMSG